MIETHTREIDGTAYQVSQFGATQGRKILARLAKALGPALAALVAGAPEGAKADAAVSRANIGEAIRALCEGLREEDLDLLTSALVEKTMVRVDADSDAWVPLKGVFDAHFAGRYAALLGWIAFGLEVNYGDFFSASSATGAVLGALGRTPSPSRSPSS